MTPDLEALGPWHDRSGLARLGPQGLVQAWVGRVYSVQRYTVDTHPTWDRLHVQRHDKRAVRSWTDLQAIKGLLEDGDDRLAVEVYPRAQRVVNLANATHLWVLPLEHELEAVLDLAHELSAYVPPARWRTLA